MRFERGRSKEEKEKEKKEKEKEKNRMNQCSCKFCMFSNQSNFSPRKQNEHLQGPN